MVLVAYLLVLLKVQDRHIFIILMSQLNQPGTIALIIFGDVPTIDNPISLFDFLLLTNSSLVMVNFKNLNPSSYET